MGVLISDVRQRCLGAGSILIGLMVQAGFNQVSVKLGLLLIFLVVLRTCSCTRTGQGGAAQRTQTSIT